jgi:hypothetical protein
VAAVAASTVAVGSRAADSPAERELVLEDPLGTHT